MNFIWPQLLILLLTVPILIALYLLAQRRRKKYALRYASLSLIKDAMGKGPGIRRHIPPLLFLLAIITLIVALARPIAVVTLPAQEGTVIMVFDVSGSMAAEDLKPNRMEAAKEAARTFVDKQNAAVKIGVVSFSDNAFVVQSPTNDRDAVNAAINRLSPQRGTAIGRGILTGLESINEEANAEDAAFSRSRSTSFGPTPSPSPTPKPLPKGMYAPAIMILLSDGESNIGPNPLDVLEPVAAQGVRVYTVGVGSPEGTILRVQGRAIRVRLDEPTMKRISEKTDGEYFNASNENDLRSIYEKLGTHLTLRTEKTEITAVFTAAGALLALVAGFLSLWWFNRLP
jgi:Ca-activated chloride channel family protein